MKRTSEEVNYYGRFLSKLCSQINSINNLLKHYIQFKWDQNCEKNIFLVQYDTQLPIGHGRFSDWRESCFWS